MDWPSARRVGLLWTLVFSALDDWVRFPAQPALQTVPGSPALKLQFVSPVMESRFLQPVHRPLSNRRSRKIWSKQTWGKGEAAPGSRAAVV